MTDESGGSGKTKEPSRLEGVVDDVFGFDFKLPRTLRDLILRPGRVADAALAGDHLRYTRPLRVMLGVYALALLVFGWFGSDVSGTFGVLYANNPAGLAAVEARLAEAGSSLAAADAVIARWTNWTTWPLIAVSSVFYVLVIWAMRPRLGLLKAALLYVVLSTASYAITVPLALVGGLFGPAGALWASASGFISMFVYAGLVLHRRAADTALGLAMRLLAFVLTTVPVLIVGSVLVLGAIEVAFKAETGLSRLGLIVEAGDPAAGP